MRNIDEVNLIYVCAHVHLNLLRISSTSSVEQIIYLLLFLSYLSFLSSSTTPPGPAQGSSQLMEVFPATLACSGVRVWVSVPGDNLDCNKEYINKVSWNLFCGCTGA